MEGYFSGCSDAANPRYGGLYPYQQLHSPASGAARCYSVHKAAPVSLGNQLISWDFATGVLSGAALAFSWTGRERRRPARRWRRRGTWPTPKTRTSGGGFAPSCQSPRLFLSSVLTDSLTETIFKILAPSS